MSDTPKEKRGIARLLETQPWIVFLLPFIVFMAFTALEPKSGEPSGIFGLSIPYTTGYPWVYTVKIALTILAVLVVLPGYRPFPFRIGPPSILVGILGVVVWVGLCDLQFESRVVKPLLAPVFDNRLGEALGLSGLLEPATTRASYNPLEQLAGSPIAAWAFLAVRFLGLALVVPIIEEMFLRGFLMRFVMARDWWEVPFGQVSVTAVVVGTLFPMMMHPAELLASAVWFTMITWLMVRTRNVWDCVAAHAVTNFLLGVYVVISGRWHFM